MLALGALEELCFSLVACTRLRRPVPCLAVFALRALYLGNGQFTILFLHHMNFFSLIHAFRECGLLFPVCVATAAGKESFPLLLLRFENRATFRTKQHRGAARVLFKNITQLPACNQHVQIHSPDLDVAQIGDPENCATNYRFLRDEPLVKVWIHFYGDHAIVVVSLGH